MFVHSLEGSWLQHSFWRTRFLLCGQAQLERLHASGIEWAIIDDTKGKGPPAPAAAQMQTLKTNAHPPVATSGLAAVREWPVHTLPGEREAKRLSARERAIEVRRASGIIKRSRRAVMSMFEDARLGNAVKARQMAPLVEKISASVELDPTIILNMARLKTKDEYTYLHSVAVCALMIHLARQMRVPEAQIPEIGMAGLLHDVGKMTIPDSILLKPEKLDEAEWATVRNHPERGHRILTASKGVSDVALDVCLRHHEKMDGTGYPGKLPGDSLSLAARMSSVCDVYDAITSQRPYNTPWSASKALSRMESWPGHFDKLVLRSFVESLGILPVGTLVRLNHDQLAIVTGESPADFAAPIVRTFHSLHTDRAIKPQDIDTARDKSCVIVKIEEPEDWGFDNWPAFSAELLAASRV